MTSFCLNLFIYLFRAIDLNSFDVKHFWRSFQFFFGPFEFLLFIFCYVCIMFLICEHFTASSSTLFFFFIFKHSNNPSNLISFYAFWWHHSKFIHTHRHIPPPPSNIRINKFHFILIFAKKRKNVSKCLNDNRKLFAIFTDSLNRRLTVIIIYHFSFYLLFWDNAKNEWNSSFFFWIVCFGLVGWLVCYCRRINNDSTSPNYPTTAIHYNA